MRPIILLLATILACPAFTFSVSAAARPTVMDLVGKWEGMVEFGKFKFGLVLRVEKNAEGRLAITMDVPDQGQKGIPVAAVLFNSPDVRIEIDPFQTAYNGKLSDDLNQMIGEFEEGPGGRPMPVTFTRSTKPDEPEVPGIFTFKAGEARDIRGHWKTGIEPMPGMNLTLGVNIGRLPDSTFRARLDVLEQAAKDIPANSVTTSNNTVELKWDLLQATFSGKLSEDGNRIEGDWTQRGKAIKTALTRLDAPATLVQKGVSYQGDAKDPNDIRGEWMGRLEIPNQKLRLIFKIGQAPDGAYTGSLTSPDQGPGELPMTSGAYARPKVTLEFKGIAGKFEGTLTNNGSVLEGTWEQFGNKMPLKLERRPAKPADKKS